MTLNSTPLTLTTAVALTLVFTVAPVEAQSTVSVGTGSAQRSTALDSAAVASVIDRLHGALTAGDSTTAVSLLAGDAIILESGGLETRTE